MWERATLFSFEFTGARGALKKKTNQSQERSEESSVQDGRCRRVRAVFGRLFAHEEPRVSESIGPARAPPLAALLDFSTQQRRWPRRLTYDIANDSGSSIRRENRWIRTTHEHVPFGISICIESFPW